MAQIRLVRSFMTVGGWTLISRIFGFIRDMMIAAYLGAGPVAEAFLVAFSLPNMFRRIFAEGAFNTAFVPIFAKKYQSDRGAEPFAQDAFSGLAWVLTALSVVAHFAMPWLVLAMASGFQGDARFDLAVSYGRICFPYILFISLTALLSGVANATGRFAAAAAAPVLLNLILIAAMGLAQWRGWPMGLVQAWAVPLAGVAQMALLWRAAAQAGYRLRLGLPRLSPDVRRLISVAGPAVLAGGVMQVNLLVGRQVASYHDGAIAWLSNADRLYQLPLGVIAVAIGVVLSAELPRRLSAGDAVGGRAAFNRASEFALMLVLPSAVGLVVLAGPIISVVYQRGAYSAEDAAATAQALMIYGLGLPAFAFQKVLQPLFYAREDTRRPFRYAVTAMVVNLVLAVGLSPILGFSAAAWGTTLAAWAMVGQLWFGSRSMGETVMADARLRQRAWRIFLACVGMGGCLWGVMALWAPVVSGPGRYVHLMGLMGVSFVSYFGTGMAIGAFSIADFRRGLRRPPAP